MKNVKISDFIMRHNGIVVDVYDKFKRRMSNKNYIDNGIFHAEKISRIQEFSYDLVT